MRSAHHRDARLDEGPALAGLDAQCFGNPWSDSVYRQELERTFAHVLVAELHTELVGLTCMWIVADEAHLLRIATATGVRRQGLGRALLERVFDRAHQQGAHRLLLEVAATNEPALGLYASFGFTVIGRRKGYYLRPPDDGLVMERVLTG